MSNKAKGETSFEVGGKQYRLVYSINALCELEDAFGEGVIQVAAKMSDPAKLRLKTLRTMFWAGLRDLDGDITEKAAGEMMTELGLARAVKLVSDAFVAAFPEAAAGPVPLADGARTDGIGLHS